MGEYRILTVRSVNRGLDVGIALFWFLWGGVFLLATLYIIIRIGIIRIGASVIYTTERSPRVGLAIFAVFVVTGVGICLYVLLSKFALSARGTVTNQSIELGAFVFAVFAYTLVVNIRISMRGFVYLSRSVRAHRLLQRRRFADANNIYERQLVKHPNDAYSWYGKTQALVGMRRRSAALESCERALATVTAKQSPELFRSQIWLTKGGILLSMHRLADALGAVDQSLALHPNYAFAWAQKAYILQRSGDNEQALIAAEKALYRGDISLTSEWRGMTLIAKAGAQNSLGSYEDAVETAREAVRFAPESSTIWVVQANALAHLGRETESQAAAQQGLANVEVQIADDPERVECWENKSALRRCLGRTDDAEAAETQVHEVLSRMTSTSRSDAL